MKKGYNLCQSCDDTTDMALRRYVKDDRVIWLCEWCYKDWKEKYDKEDVENTS